MKNFTYFNHFTLLWYKDFVEVCIIPSTQESSLNQPPHDKSTPYNSSRIEYWSTTLKLVGFFLAGLIISKMGMTKIFSPKIEEGTND